MVGKKSCPALFAVSSGKERFPLLLLLPLILLEGTSLGGVDRNEIDDGNTGTALEDESSARGDSAMKLESSWRESSESSSLCDVWSGLDVSFVRSACVLCFLMGDEHPPDDDVTKNVANVGGGGGILLGMGGTSGPSPSCVLLDGAGCMAGPSGLMVWAVVVPRDR